MNPNRRQFLGLPGIPAQGGRSSSAPPILVDENIYSLILLGSPWRPIIPPPVATIGPSDQQVFLYLCSQIPAGAPVSDIDTDQKKWSLMLLGMPFRNIWGTLEDGVISQGDEQQAAFLYSGILAQFVPNPPPVFIYPAASLDLFRPVNIDFGHRPSNIDFGHRPINIDLPRRTNR